MKKTIWKRISESQLRKKNKFWSFVAKGKISISVGSPKIPRDANEFFFPGGNFEKLGYRKECIKKGSAFDNVRSI